MCQSIKHLTYTLFLAILLLPIGCGADSSLTVIDPPTMTQEELEELAKQQSEHYSDISEAERAASYKQ